MSDCLKMNEYGVWVKKTAPYGMKIVTRSKRGYYLENRETWHEQLIITDKDPPNVWWRK